MPKLTKREMIAAMCLQGILANSAHELTYPEAAEEAIRHADVLIVELNKAQFEEQV